MIVFHDLNETSTFPPGKSQVMSQPLHTSWFLHPGVAPTQFLLPHRGKVSRCSWISDEKNEGRLKKKKDHNLKPFRPPFFWAHHFGALQPLVFGDVYQKNIPEQLEALLKNALMISLKASFRLSKLNYTREKLTWQWKIIIFNRR